MQCRADYKPARKCTGFRVGGHFGLTVGEVFKRQEAGGKRSPLPSLVPGLRSEAAVGHAERLTRDELTAIDAKTYKGSFSFLNTRM